MKTEEAMKKKDEIKDFIFKYINDRADIWYNLKSFCKDWGLEYQKLSKFLDSKFNAHEKHINIIKKYDLKILQFK